MMVSVAAQQNFARLIMTIAPTPEFGDEEKDLKVGFEKGMTKAFYLIRSKLSITEVDFSAVYEETHRTLGDTHSNPETYKKNVAEAIDAASHQIPKCVVEQWKEVLLKEHPNENLNQIYFLFCSAKWRYEIHNKTDAQTLGRAVYMAAVLNAVQSIYPAWNTPIEQIHEDDHIRFYQEIIYIPKYEVLLKPPRVECADKVREIYLQAQFAIDNPQPSRTLEYIIMDRNEYRKLWAAAWLDCAGVKVSDQEIASHSQRIFAIMDTY